MAQIKRRRVWTDSDKEALIRGAAAFTGSIVQFLDKNRLSGSWFRTMRRRYLKAHPEFNVETPASVERSTSRGWPVDPEERRKEMKRRMAARKPKPKVTLKPHSATPFLSHSKPEQTALIKEYYAIPLKDYAAKEAWREKYGVSQPMVTYYHKSLVLKVHSKIAHPAPSNPAVAAVMVRYKQLPNREKPAWREAHNLSPSQVSAIMRGKATSFIASRALDGTGSQELALIPGPIPIRQYARQTLLPQEAPHPHVPVTLEDAVMAFEVKRDHMNEFIDQLKRMQRGGR